jgi:hypothetical protein
MERKPWMDPQVLFEGDKSFNLHLCAQDILGAAAEMIAAQRPGSGKEKLCALRLELDALCLFANTISSRISQTVYQKLSEVVAAFS